MEYNVFREWKIKHTDNMPLSTDWCENLGTIICSLIDLIQETFWCSCTVPNTVLGIRKQKQTTPSLCFWKASVMQPQGTRQGMSLIHLNE